MAFCFSSVKSITRRKVQRRKKKTVFWITEDILSSGL